MSSNGLVKVFDVADSGFKNWEFPAFGLIFVFVGTVIFFGPKILRAFNVPYLNSPSMQLNIFRYFFLGFAILWTTTAFLMTYQGYARHQQVVAYGCKIVEGTVDNFVPMPYEGHADESFAVEGVRFSYSDYIVTDAFNNTSSHGGPITAGEYVRICYDPSDNAILRLEIRGFHSRLKNYAQGDSMFGDSAPSEQDANHFFPPQDAAFARYGWLANFWVVVYFLDIWLTLTMVLSYLRTFRVAKRISIANTKLRSSLLSEEKIKLRNNLARWDGVNGALWVRARGFNFLRVPIMVARFEVDTSNYKIVAEEIRLSLGAISVFVMFLITALLLFSSTIPDRNQAYIVCGAVVIFFSIAAIFNFRRLGRRMEDLASDALLEVSERL